MCFLEGRGGRACFVLRDLRAREHGTVRAARLVAVCAMTLLAVSSSRPAHLAADAPVDAVILAGDSAGPAQEVLALTLASIVRFAPFVHRIHVLSESAQPGLHELLNRWIHAQRRRVIFREPTAAFWADQEVAEQLLVVEPGCLLLRAARAESFFRAGHPVLRGQWAVQDDHGWWRVWMGRLLQSLRSSHGALRQCRRLQGRAASRAGFGKTYFYTGTGAQPVRRSTMARLVATEPECASSWWRTTGLEPTAHVAAWNPLAWAHHQEIQAGTAHQRPGSSGVLLDLAALQPDQLTRQLARARMDASWLVISLMQLHALRVGAQDILLPWLRDVIGPGPIERDEALGGAGSRTCAPSAEEAQADGLCDVPAKALKTG